MKFIKNPVLRILSVLKRIPLLKAVKNIKLIFLLFTCFLFQLSSLFAGGLIRYPNGYKGDKPFKIISKNKVASPLDKRGKLTNEFTQTIAISVSKNRRFDYIAVSNIVKGKVTNLKGEPLIGVSVTIKGTTASTSTDSKGNYSIDVPANGILVFSSIGFETKEIPVNGRSSVDLEMEEGASSLNDVVVVGYGTQKKIDLTGAVDQISGKSLAKRPIANIFQGLEGASPGLNITYYGGEPGTVPGVNIRGFTSINGGEPLIVIDGIAATNADLLRLNPSDVASITVLRDASSAAIYGARASFGVLLITTKKSEPGGRQTISYSNYYALSKPTDLNKPITDPYIYDKIMDEASGNTPWHYETFTPWQYAWAKQRSDDPSSAPAAMVDPDDPTQWTYMGNTDWNSYFYNKSSPSQYQSLSFSGSSSNGKKMPIGYLLSADYTDEDGLDKLTTDDWKRYGLIGRFNLSPAPWLKLDDNVNLYQLNTDAPSTTIGFKPNGVTSTLTLTPTDVAKNPDGTWANNNGGILAAEITGGGRSDQTTLGFQNTVRGVASFFNNALQITGDVSNKRAFWTYDSTSLPFTIGLGPNNVQVENPQGYVSKTNISENQDVVDLYVNYKKNFGYNAISLMAGYNQESYEWSPTQAAITGVISNSNPYLGVSTGTAYVSNSSYGGYYSYATRSYFGRINYIYKDKYILEGNGRFDGSSRFPANNRWGFFPSISGAWIASKESFMDFLKPDISILKFRVSYGSLGNQNLPYYGYLQTLPIGQQVNAIVNGQQPNVVSAPALSVNPNSYTWERVNTANIGADIGLLNDKISASFDYYIRNTIGMIAPTQELPAVLGANAPNENSANLSTKGWEFSINYRNTFNVASSPLSFSAKLILSNSKSTITKYDNPSGLFSAAYRPGEVIGELWGLTNNGFFQNNQEIAKLDESQIVPWSSLPIVAGWPEYKDLNGDGQITRGPSDKDPGDMRIIGNTSPRDLFGFNLNANWKGIDFSMFLQGIAKMDVYPHEFLYWGPFQQPYGEVYPWNLNFYRATSETTAERAQDSKAWINAGLANANTNSFFPVLEAWLSDSNYGAGLDIPQTQYLMNGAYLRVKNITLGYTFPPSAFKRLGIRGIESIRLFFSGENIYEFSAVKKYFDPESLTDGGYGNEYPYQRKYSFGLNLNL